MRATRWRLNPLQALYLLFIAYLFWSLVFVPRAFAEAPLIHGQGRLFEVSREGAPPSYVFGTIHINDKKVLKLPRPVAKALRQSRMLMLEFDDNYDSGALMRAWTYPNSKKLRTVIGPEMYRQVMQLAKKMRLRRDVISRLKPGPLWYTLSFMSWQRGGGVLGPPALDHALMHFAKKKRIPIVGLDLNEESAAILVSVFSEAEQIELLRLTLESFTKAEVPEARDQGTSWVNRLNEGRDLYLAGDLDGLMKMHDDGLSEFGQELSQKFDHELLNVRNHRWIPRMQKHLAHGGVFIAVGAAHLPGETGLLHLLEKEGYTVRRVL